MKQTIVTLLILCSTALGAAAQDNGSNTPPPTAITFGYLSYNEALHAMNDYKEAQQQLAELRETYDKELQRAEQEFSRQMAEYIDGQRTFPDNILLKRQKELQQIMQQNIDFKTEAERLLSQAEAEAMQPIRKRLNDLLQQTGKERGYAFILNTDNNNCPFVSGTLGEDITADIISRLNK